MGLYKDPLIPFAGPIGEGNLSEAQIQKILLSNVRKLGRENLSTIPWSHILTFDPLIKGIPEYFQTLEKVIQDSPGKGFFLCFIAALQVSALFCGKQLPECLYMHDPVNNLNNACLAYREGKRYPIDDQVDYLVANGILIPLKPKASFFPLHSIGQAGTLIVQQQLVFPPLNNLEPFGHWIALLNFNAMGGILTPYGAGPSAYDDFIALGDCESIYSASFYNYTQQQHRDFPVSDLHAKTQDTGDVFCYFLNCKNL